MCKGSKFRKEKRSGKHLVRFEIHEKLCFRAKILTNFYGTGQRQMDKRRVRCRRVVSCPFYQIYVRLFTNVHSDPGHSAYGSLLNPSQRGFRTYCETR